MATQLPSLQSLFTFIQNDDLESIKNWVLEGGQFDSWDEDGLTPLEVAIRENNTKMAEVLLAGGADPSLPNAQGLTPLMLAIFMGELPLVEILVHHGINLNQGDKKGKTALMYAVLEGHLEMAQFLMLQGADLEIADDAHRTAIFYAVMCLDESNMATLLKFDLEGENSSEVTRVAGTSLSPSENVQIVKGSAAPNDPDPKYTLRSAPATSVGSFRVRPQTDENFHKNVRLISQVLMERMAKLDLLDELGQAPIHYAANVADEEVLTSMAQAGGNVLIQNGQGQAAKDILVVKGKEELAQKIHVLFDKVQKEFAEKKTVSGGGTTEKMGEEFIWVRGNAEAGKEDNGLTLIKGQTSTFELDSASLKVKGQAAPKNSVSTLKKINSKNSHGQTRLMVAAYKGEFTMVKGLVEMGADIELKDGHGDNALVYAIRGKSLEIVQFLCGLQKNLDAKDGDGLTALAVAVTQDWAPGIRYLREKGANVEVKVKGMNLLILAAKYGAAEATKILLEGGPSPREKDFRGKDALAHAKANHHGEVERLLIHWMEKNPGR